MALLLVLEIEFGSMGSQPYHRVSNHCSAKSVNGAFTLQDGAILGQSKTGWINYDTPPGEVSLR